MAKTVYYKALNPDGTTPQGFGEYDPANKEWQKPIEGELVACMNGYHVLRLTDILEWECPELWQVEVKGHVVKEDTKAVCRTFRFVEKVATWSERTQRLLACDIAEHVQHIWLKEYPYDLRPQHAIDTARQFANGEATEQELAAAWDAARDAARDAATPAARDAATPAAWDAAWAAAWDAATPAARDAATPAAWDAAWDAAWAAATAAARAAAWDAAWAAERKWQIERLKFYLDGKGG